MRRWFVTLFVASAGACSQSYGSVDGPSDSGAPVDDASTEAAPTRDADVSDVPTSVDAGGDAADADAADAADAAPLPGPALVAIGSFSIDATEVTQAHYAAFLATAPPLSLQPGGADCAFNTTFAPAAGAPGQSGLPVEVNYCQAAAYCKWAGKHLCGAIGGGAVMSGKIADPAVSQWMNACSHAGASTFSYGSTFDGAKCATYDTVPRPNAPLPAGTQPACHGTTPPYSSIFDLSGNVEEWEDNCTGSSCSTRGGSWALNQTYSQCTGVAGRYRNQSFGFRCCKD